jgi:hypothetical protein
MLAWRWERAGVMLAEIGEDSPVMQVIERTGKHHDVREGEFDRVRGQRLPERVVLECNCRARLVLDGRMSAWHSGFGALECGVCGGRFVVAARTAAHHEHRYSWLEGCLERLEGKEARHKYYARLAEEQGASQ